MTETITSQPATYTYEEAYQACIEYFNNDDLAASIFVDKYALRDNVGNLLEKTPVDTHRRLSKEFARIEKKYPNPMTEDEIFSYLDRFAFIVPQGSPMSAIGNPYQIQSCGNCFSINSPFDSYGGIFYTDQQFAQLMKRRGGVGVDLSTLRPKDRPVQNAAKTTDGISVFIDRFSNTCREVAQKGRRGASIQLLNVHHPEILTFIRIKRDKKRATGSNISIKVTDEFIEAVKNDTDYELRWPVDSSSPQISQKIKARDVWNEFIDSNYNDAEPGVIFWDTAIKNSASNCYGVVNSNFYDKAVNPCGEIIMGNDSCRLLAINLYSFVKNKFTQKAYFDFELFDKVTQISQRLMDDLVDLEIELIGKIIDKIDSDTEPDYIKKIEKETWTDLLDTCKNGRRTGLGVTGLADAIASMGIRYGSDESISKTEEIYKHLCINAYKSSCIMAKERGPFPIFDFKIDKNSEFVKKVVNSDKDLKKIYESHGRRNVALTTTPPAGSISLLTQTTSGIEPVFQLKYTRRKKVNPGDKNVKISFVDGLGDSWQEYNIFHKGLQDWMDVTGETDIEKSPYYQSTSSEIDWIKSVDIQASAQKWICHSISKTCNIPKDTPKELVEKIYLRAHEMGCKGFTIYREGSRDGVLIDQKQETKQKIKKSEAPKRPETLPCDIFHVKVKGEEYFVIVGLWNDEDPYELFAGKNGNIPKTAKKGSVTKTSRGHYNLILEDGTKIDNISKYIDDIEEALTRSWSTSLRHGVHIKYIVHQIEKTEGTPANFAKSVCKTLKKYIPDDTVVTGEDCEKCGGKLIRQEGCCKCSQCNFTKCG